MGYVAAVFLLAIAILVLVSIGARALQIYIPGLNVYAGFCMAAATFFALASTFADEKHIRVSLFLSLASPRFRYGLELWCLAAATVIATWATLSFSKMTLLSYEFGEKSQSIDATPLWVPQSSLVVGSAVFALACFHGLLRSVAQGPSASAGELVDDPIE